MSLFEEIPDDVVKNILKLDEGTYNSVFRAIRHATGPLTREDFPPTFKDKEQQESRNKMKERGGMAYVISKQSSFSLEDYSVSLFDSLEAIKSRLWKNESLKKVFPRFAEGTIDKEKGFAPANKNGVHINFYLYSFSNKNPVVDFNIMEMKSNE